MKFITINTLVSESYDILLALPNPIFCQPHTHQLIFVLGVKKVSGLLLISIWFQREKLDKNKEINLQ
jgi:hypothetical protein